MMKIKNIIIIASCFLISCNNQSLVKETCHLQIENHGCTYEGLKESYFVGDTAEITFKAKNDLFNLPKKDDLKIYGSKEYTYDESNGKLSLKLDSNTGVVVTSNPRIGGRESSYGEVRKFSYDHMPNDPETAPIPFNKADIHWVFPTLNEEDINQEFDIELIEILLKNLLNLDSDVEFQYKLKEDTVTIDINEYPQDFIIMGYAILETILYNNRISINPLLDSFTYNEESKVAECLINNAVSISTKDLKLKGPIIWTIDENDLITNFRLYIVQGGAAYKNLNSHIPGYVDFSYYFKEVGE